MIDEAHDDLMATSESISADAERLQAIEAQKRALQPGDARLDDLAEEAERIAREIAVKTTIETDIAETIADGTDGAGGA
jgi:hypothetical protein